MDNIDELRKKIDLIDENIMHLFVDRFSIAQEILSIKIQNKLNADDFKREDEIINKLYAKFHEKIPKFIIEKLYKTIFSISKENFKKSHQNLTALELLKLRPIIIAGPCVVESREQIFKIAESLSSLGIKFLRGGAFKPRTNPQSFQGLGDEGLNFLLDAACKFQMYTVTEILDINQLERNYDKIDLIQVGSRNMSSYGFLKQVGKISAKDEKPVILKRGFAATFNEFINAAEYIRQEGNPNVLLCLRGIRTFEQIDSKLRFTPDIGAILELKERSDMPVIFDPSHSTGVSNYVLPIAKAALAAGADGLMIECHYNPQEALIDGFQAILPQDLKVITDETSN
jgi:3-deoxy-7-phosphoheptulonate synthase